MGSMKFLVLSALVAVSSCQLVAYHNGAVVPADTPAVAAAKLAHANAGGVVNLEGVLAHGYAAGYPYGYAGYFGGLVGHANGAVVPVDEPAVVAAKAAHAAAGYPYGYAGYPYGAPVHAGFAGLVAHPNGAVVPVEPADVVAARAEHLAAKAEA